MRLKMFKVKVMYLIKFNVNIAYKIYGSIIINFKFKSNFEYYNKFCDAIFFLTIQLFKPS